ncbi:hypothetical protein [Magnetovibrio blakemorei]|uniref:hypothetical protein n=1 Tax=Magnetovibrio blakemorei TaxID=28181 RepID=UPI000A07A1E2
MTSRRYQSGEMDYSGRISKFGDGLLRSLNLRSREQPVDHCSQVPSDERLGPTHSQTYALSLIKVHGKRCDDHTGVISAVWFQGRSDSIWLCLCPATMALRVAVI